jgi:DtxR family Mn-dependent transcriptional regulator
MEDALKHLHGGEYSGRPCSIDSVAGALEISRGRAARLVTRLETLELIHSDGVGFPLTDTGRAYALRLLRTHRLWERYLADRTNVKPTDWHDEAEKAEHKMKPEETEALAARMGNPLYDPHGDPIPTAEGEIPPQEGVALTSLNPGQTGAVVHLEDEPREVFQQIVEAGLAPLMRIRLEEVTPDMVRFTADGQQCELEPVAATNVTVLPLPQAEVGEGPFEHLGDLEPGEFAAVAQIAPQCQGLQRRRLLDLGFVPGTVVGAELRGASGDPVGYRVRGALIALRKEQAEWIYVHRTSRGIQQ